MQLENRNAGVHSDMNKVQELAEALLNSEGHYWKFYRKEDVSDLLHEMRTNAQ